MHIRHTSTRPVWRNKLRLSVTKIDTHTRSADAKLQTYFADDERRPAPNGGTADEETAGPPPLGKGGTGDGATAIPIRAGSGCLDSTAGHSPQRGLSTPVPWPFWKTADGALSDICNQKRFNVQPMRR